MAATGEIVGRAHELGTELAAVALVGERGVGETIADNDAARGKCRLDDLAHHLGASRLEEQELGKRHHRVVVLVEKERADLLAQARTAWFMHAQDRVTPILEPFGEKVGLGRLADAIVAFEREENAPGAICVVIHAAMVPRLLLGRGLFLCRGLLLGPTARLLGLLGLLLLTLGAVHVHADAPRPRAVETMTSGAPHSSHTSPVAVMSPRWGSG